MDSQEKVLRMLFTGWCQVFCCWKCMLVSWKKKNNKKTCAVWQEVKCKKKMLSTQYHCNEISVYQIGNSSILLYTNDKEKSHVSFYGPTDKSALHKFWGCKMDFLPPKWQFWVQFSPIYSLFKWTRTPVVPVWLTRVLKIHLIINQRSSINTDIDLFPCSWLI